MITDTQREKRKSNLGGSDLARIVTGAFGGAARVQHEKLYDIEDAASVVMELGNDLEPSLLDYAQDVVGPIRRNVERRVPGTVILVHLDAVVIETGRNVEAKTSGLLWTPAAGEFGEPGTADVPDYVTVQAHAGFCATTADRCHVPVWHPHRGKVMYEIPCQSELVETLMELAPAWWQRHIVDRDPVEISEQQATHVLDAIRRTRREPNSIVPIANVDIVDTWQKMNAARLAMEKVEDHYKAMVLQQLGDAEAGQLPDGRWVEYKAVDTRYFDKVRLERERPDIAAEYTTTVVRRTARVVKEPKRKGTKE